MGEFLSFLSTLIWQAIVFSAFFFFRMELKTLMARLASLKHGDTQLVFQQNSSEGLAPSKEIAEALEIRDEAGFFTEKGIKGLVEHSPELTAGEKIANALLVFATETQQTWLVSTNRYVYFVLDDENTRADQRLIRMKRQLSESRPIRIRKKRSILTGAFALGKEPYWLFSTELLGHESAAKAELERFLKGAESVTSNEK